MLDRLQLAAGAIGKGQYVLDPITVFALKTMDQGQSVLNLVQPAGVELDPIPVFSQQAGQILQMVTQRLGGLAQVLSRGIKTGQS